MDQKVTSRWRYRALQWLVLMSTNDKSWHSVDEVKADGRRLISNYYFSLIRQTVTRRRTSLILWRGPSKNLGSLQRSTAMCEHRLPIQKKWICKEVLREELTGPQASLPATPRFPAASTAGISRRW